METASSLAGALQAMGERDSAERMVQRVLGFRRAQYGDSHRLVASSMNHLGELRWNAGDADEGSRLIGQSLAINRRIGAVPEVLAGNLNDLGSVMRSVGQLTEAEPLLREALALREKALGMKHPAVPATMVTLGSVLRDQQIYVASESLLVGRSLFDAEHSASIIPTSSPRRSVLPTAWGRKEVPEAESLLRDAIEMNRRLLGRHDPEIGMDVTAHCCTSAAIWRKPNPFIAKPSPYWRTHSEPRIRAPTSRAWPWGTPLVERGDARGGERLLRRVVEARTAKNGPTHYQTLNARADPGWSLARQGRLVAAESVLIASHSAWKPRPGVRDSAALRRLRETIVDVSLRMKKNEQANRYRSLRNSIAAPTPH